jgi:3-dehydroquinate synthetase
MVETTAIEKKSLESHVELCAERYKFMEAKLETLDEKITKIEEVVDEVHNCVHKLTTRRNDQVMQWGGGIILTLVGVIGWLLANYVL